MSVSLGVVVHWPADEIWTMCCGALSALGSGSILLTVLLFPMMVRRKLFMHVIVMMSLTDFIASIFCAIGFPRNATLCAMQGVATTFGFLTSWLWTTMLAYQLYYLVRKGRPKYTLIGMHCLVWGFTIIMFLIPLLLSVYYGLEDSYLGKCLCGFTGTPHRNVAIWINVHFSVAVVCMALQVYFSARVYIKFTLPLHRRRLRKRLAAAAAASFYPGGVAAHQASNPVHMQGQGAANDRLKATKQVGGGRKRSVSSDRVPVIASAVNILALYPAGFILSWLPVSVLCFLISSGVYTYSYASGGPDSVALSFFRGLGPLYGAFLAACFYSRSSEARRRWYYLFIHHWVVVARCLCCSPSHASSAAAPSSRGRGRGHGLGGHADNHLPERDDEGNYNEESPYPYSHQRDRAVSATSKFAAQLKHHYRSSEIVNMLRDTYITQGEDFQEDEEQAEGGAGGAGWPRSLTLSVAEAGEDIDYGFEDDEEEALDEAGLGQGRGLGSQRSVAAAAVGMDAPAPRLSAIDIELSRSVDYIPHR